MSNFSSKTKDPLQKFSHEEKVVLYTNTDGKVVVGVFYSKNNFWLTQKTIAELFGVNVPAVSRHLKNIYSSIELTKEATVSKMEIVQIEGRRKVLREVEVYNLDAVIAVGYRVNSIKATHFRIWATNTLREFMLKGFVLNDQMLKNGNAFGEDYFEELLEKIREIRASERRAYQKIADVFEQCSSDYRSRSEETKKFFQIIQNQLHFATTGKTAAEIVYQRANSEKPFMGLTSWKNSPKGKILKSDTLIAKNYLKKDEISKLNRLVTMFIDFAELKALKKQIMSMKDWLFQVEKFLSLTDQQVLRHAGRVSHEMAVAKASEEYEKYRVDQNKKYLSDFDRACIKYLKEGR
ncbi:MAG: virulence RhuM family protein [Candidatus Algichlamydia australiensis]|nr:virulence RhuM family protein [Chlamydiales bacterium]